MGNTLTLLLNIINKEDMNSVNYKIADYLLHHLGEIEQITTGQLATDCHVSKSTISRFCKHLGLEDFFDLQVMIRHPFVDQYDNLSHLNSLNSVQEYIEKVKKDVESIEKVYIDDVINDLLDYESVYVMGHMQSSLPAYNLQYNLAQVGKYIKCIDNVVVQKRIIANATNNDLIIIFSNSGKFAERILIKKSELKKCMGKIYVISLNSPNITPFYVHRWISWKSQSDSFISMNTMFSLSQIMVIKFLKKFYKNSVLDNK